MAEYGGLGCAAHHTCRVIEREFCRAELVHGQLPNHPGRMMPGQLHAMTVTING